MAQVIDKVSTNFIVLLADDTVEELFDLIENQKPDYVIIKRIEKTNDNQIINVCHYCFLAELILNFRKENHERASNYPRISEFLELHLTDSKELKKLSDNNLLTENDEIKKIVQHATGSDIIPLANTNKIIGLIDPQKNIPNASYELLHFHYVIKPRWTRKGIRRYQDDPKPKVKKFVTAKLRDKLQAGKEELFVVQIKGAESSDPLTFQKPVEIDPNQLEPNATQAELDVEVLCDPPDIADIVGKRKQLMIVPLDEGDSNSVSFEIMPKKKGACKVTARIYYRKTNLEVGTIQLKRCVGIERGNEEPTTASDANMNKDRRAPDLIMSINQVNEGQSENMLEYYIEIRAYEKLGILGKKFGKQTVANPEEKFKKIFQKIEAINPQDFSTQKAKIAIESVGNALWNTLIPEDFKEFYWKSIWENNAIKSIHILSNEPWIPWEIIKPNKAGKRDKFFCEKFAIGRWISSETSPLKPYIKTIKLVRPIDSTLPKDETEWIEKEFRDACSRISSFKQLAKCLKEENFDLMHFSTHGSFNDILDPNSSYVELENKEHFSVDNLQDEDKCQSIKRNHPLVILNACETAKQGFSLTGVGGWAHQFIFREAYGFIGTLWNVSDTIAHDFTISLYQNLKLAIPLNEAVRQARIDVRKNAKEKGDPSWLAYCLYAPPNDVVQIK